MNLLLGEIWKSISSTLRNEDQYPKKENLRIKEIDNHFFIQHKRRFLFVFHIWEYLESDERPLIFNTLHEAIEFIEEITH